MAPSRSFIKIILCFALVLCAGCGQSLFPFGKNTAAVPQLSVPGHASSAPLLPAPLSVEPSPSAKKPVFYDTGGDYTSSYQTSVLTEDVSLSGRVLISGVLTIARQATLRILPGTVIFFAPDRNGRQDGALVIQGRIDAVGTPDALIIFKAATPDRSKDGWRGIIVLGSDKNNLFEYCRIEGATVGLDSVFSTVSLKNAVLLSCRTGVRLQGALFQSSGGAVSDADLGFDLRDSESYLRDVSCADNTKGLSLSRGSLSVKGSSFLRNAANALEAADAKIRISGADISKNGAGLVLAGSEGTIENCMIFENREYGLQLLHSRMKILDNKISMNIGIGIMADSGNSAAWGNNISLNGLYDFYNAGSEEFRAIGNWWGAPPGSARKRRIFDQSVDQRSGAVLTFPELLSSPPGLK